VSRRVPPRRRRAIAKVCPGADCDTCVDRGEPDHGLNRNMGRFGPPPEHG
jgi:hypothetical protein